MTEASGERFKPPKANSKHFAQAINDASEGLSAHITGVKFQCACIHILSTLSSKTPLQCHKITEMSSYLNSNMPLLFYNPIDVPSGMMLCRFCTCGTSGNILYNKICRLLVSIPQVPTCQACHRPLAWRVSAYI